MGTVKAILFDFDGTLVFGEPDIWSLYTQFARDYGLVVSEDATRSAERFAHHYYAGFNYKEDYDRLGGGLAWRLYYMQRTLHVMTGGRVPVDDLLDAAKYVGARLGEEPRQRQVPPDVRATLDRLLADGYTLGLVTNRRDDEMSEVYDPHGLHHYFKFTVTVSGGIAPKPFRAMFDLALARAGCTAAEAMHVGDNPYADVAGAEAAGIRAVLYDPKRLFPEAECCVITEFPQLLDLVAR
ncbi:MAG: HAD family hydrolase [Chloroflexi bacterium]|nr:HAD family hydrolase [Chloroflexota bacterium]